MLHKTTESAILEKEWQKTFMIKNKKADEMNWERRKKHIQKNCVKIGDLMRCALRTRLSGMREVISGFTQKEMRKTAVSGQCQFVCNYWKGLWRGRNLFFCAAFLVSSCGWRLAWLVHCSPSWTSGTRRKPACFWTADIISRRLRKVASRYKIRSLQRLYQKD